MLRYNMGPAGYWPGDWSRVAPHELPGPAAPAQPGDSLARPARGPRRQRGPRLRHERLP